VKGEARHHLDRVFGLGTEEKKYASMSKSRKRNGSYYMKKKNKFASYFNMQRDQHLTPRRND
jgi:hypothetical protein